MSVETAVPGDRMAQLRAANSAGVLASHEAVRGMLEYQHDMSTGRVSCRLPLFS
jgi:hypothetical protein